MRTPNAACFIDTGSQPTHLHYPSSMIADAYAQTASFRPPPTLRSAIPRHSISSTGRSPAHAHTARSSASSTPRMSAGGVSPVHTARLRNLNGNSPTVGTHVLYWMSTSVRTIQNDALEHAAYLSNTLKKPLRAAYVFDTTALDGHPLPERHAAFLLEGLVDVQEALRRRQVPFVTVTSEHRVCTVMANLARNAAAVVTDTSYLTPGIDVRKEVAAEIRGPLIVVEADIVVPVETASSKAEHAARTIRPKITKQLHEYLAAASEVTLEHQESCDKDEWISSMSTAIRSLDLSNIDEVLASVEGLDLGAPRVSSLTGGQNQAQRVLKTFLDKKLSVYANGRNEPSKQLQSDLSPYLRAGNISPVDIVLQTKAKTKGKRSFKESEDSFLEELIVRRELSINACWFNPGKYDIYDHIVPNFARESLQLHKADKRPHIYSYDELEAGATNDVYWNAAQLEMVVRGKLHGYMRMYWAKQIIGWVKDPAQAMEYALRLNNRWELDAVDPNSYVGVIWCFGLHDRGWRERPIWGKVRYMNEGGLKRKFDMGAYVAMVDQMVEREGLPKHISDMRKARKKKGRQTTIQQSLKRKSASTSQSRSKRQKRATSEKSDKNSKA